MLTKVRNSPAFVVCLLLIQLAVCSAGPTRSSNSIADKLRTLANIRRTTRHDPYALQAYYRPNDANELNHAADTNELFIATTEELLVVEPEMNTESGGIHDPFHSFVAPDVEPHHLSHSVTTESPAFTEFQDSFHSVSNDRESAPENPSDSLSPPLLPTVPSDAVHLPFTYPSVNATSFPSATYIGIGSLPLMPIEAIPFVTSESPDHAAVQDNLPSVASPGQVNNVGVVLLDWNQEENTTPPSYTGSPISVNHSTDDSDTSYIVSTVPTKIGSSSRRPFGSSPQPRELGFPPVSNTHENFDVQVNWAEFR